MTIGFASEFYTLWDVQMEPTYDTFNGQSYQSGEKFTCIYFQNLSKTLEGAKIRATELGFPDLVVDEELRGQSRSFTRFSEFAKPEYDAHQFKFGRHEGGDIRTCEDLKYIKYYYYETMNEFAMARYAELDSTVQIIDGELLCDTDIVFQNIKKGKYELSAVSNFSVEDRGSEGMFVYVKVEFEPDTDAEYALLENNPWGIRIRIEDDKLYLVRKEYRGHEYYVPKGIRSFKNTNFKLIDGSVVIS